MPKRKRPTGETGPRPSSAAEHNAQTSQEDASDRRSEFEVKPKVANKKKRKRSKKSDNRKKDNAGSTLNSPKRSGQKHILNGLTLAVTTLDKKREDNSNSRTDDATLANSSTAQLSWKNTIDKCKQNGATITSQVHKRVNALIVSDAAVRNSTQRVRKALKLGVPIVDIGWIEACIKDSNRVDWADYLRNDEAKRAAGAKKKSSAVVPSGEEGCDVKFDVSNDDANAISGWSEAVELDCCCVCHENGDLECPWCTGKTECNLTKKRLGTK
jgi:hypothetical protein